MKQRNTLVAAVCCLVLAITFAACDPGGSDSLTGPALSGSTGDTTEHQSTGEADVPPPIPLEQMPMVMSRSAVLQDVELHVAKKVAKRLKKLDKAGKRKLHLAHARARRLLSKTPEPDDVAVAALQHELDDAMAPLLTPGDRKRIEAAARRISQLPMNAADGTTLTLGKVDPCTDACTNSYAVQVVAAEVMYLSGLAGCAFTGPIAPACFAVATVIRAAELVSSTVSYTSCLKACREGEGS